MFRGPHELDRLDLPLRMLVHDWRRFWPAVLAVAFTGALALVQGALLVGIFSSAGVYVTASSADLWLGYPETQSVELGHAIPESAEMRVRLDPAVAHVERMQWLDAEWRSPAKRDVVPVVVVGIDPGRTGLLFAKAIPEHLRARLREPGTCLVDAADRDKLGLLDANRGEVNGHQLRIVGEARGLRGLAGVNLITSASTAEALGARDFKARSATYFLARLRDPDDAMVVRDRLQQTRATPNFSVWTSSQLARRSMLFWLFDTGAGLAFVFVATMVAIAGCVITSQTLVAATAGSMRQFAMLRALGVSSGNLRRVVLVQSIVIGLGGLLLAVAVSAAMVLLARYHFVPATLSAPILLGGVALVMIVVCVSALVAGRTLRHADPVALLR